MFASEWDIPGRGCGADEERIREKRDDNGHNEGGFRGEIKNFCMGYCRHLQYLDEDPCIL